MAGLFLRLASALEWRWEEADMYQGAKHGILFRSSSAIDSLAQADTFVFDKTGTLTSGLLDIGDGVNDAPALIAADVGLAMPRGADLARATADIVLLDDHLQTLLAARTLSVGTLRLIRNHFRISTGVNTAVIAGAAFGLLSPVWSALLHNGMTLGVLLNSMAGVSLKTDRLDVLKD